MSTRVDFTELAWLDVEEWLKRDTRVVLPLGATEQHGNLSLGTDLLFVDRVTRRACERAAVLRAPALPFGASAFATRFPGSLSLRTATICGVIEDLVDCLYRQGFRRLVFATGHGGNEVITGVLSEVTLDRPQLAVYYRDAWQGLNPIVQQVNRERGWPDAEHASWYEAFAFNRVREIPDTERSFPPHPDFPPFPLNARLAPEHLAVGVQSGRFDARDPELMDRLLEAAIADLAQFLAAIPAEAPEH
jgi:creatinine amidohydrolase